MNSSYRTAGRGTPDGTRTHRKTHFECVVYANSTTGAYCGSFYELPIFGAQNGTRTHKPKHWTLKPACIPIPPFGQKGHYIMTVGALAET